MNAIIQRTTFPPRLKKKADQALNHIGNNNLTVIYYRLDDLDFCNADTTFGRRKMQRLEGDGWVELGSYSQRSAKFLVSDIEWIRHQTQPTRGRPSNQSSDVGGTGTADNWPAWMDTPPYPFFTE